MARVGTWLCVAAVLLTVGCDSGTKDVPDATPDAAAEPDAAVEVLITNSGVRCKKNKDCKGPGAECLKELDLGAGNPVDLKNGYCSAACTLDEECGATGACAGVGTTELLTEQLGGAISPDALPLPFTCSRRCSPIAPDCRKGYQCSTLLNLVSGNLPDFGLPTGILTGLAGGSTQAFCLPGDPPPVARVPDAGPEPDASKPPADPDAGPDAGAADAATDAGDAATAP